MYIPVRSLKLSSQCIWLCWSEGKKPSTGECVQDATVCAGKARSLMCGAALEGQPLPTGCCRGGLWEELGQGWRETPFTADPFGWVDSYFLSFFLPYTCFEVFKWEKRRRISDGSPRAAEIIQQLPSTGCTSSWALF